MVWPRQKDARGENTEIYCIMEWNGYHGREGREDVQKKRGWKDYEQP